LTASGLVLLGSATGGMTGDIFQLYVVGTLGYSSSWISVVALSMAVTVPVQLLAPRLVDGIGHRRVMTLGSVMVITALLIIFAASVFVAHSRLAAAVCLVAGSTLAGIGISISFGSASSGAAWSSWYAEFTDSSQRPLFLSMLSFTSQSTMIAAFVIQTFVFGGQVTEVFYRGVLLYCVIYMLGAIIIYRQFPDPREVRHETASRICWRELMRNPDYRLILFASAALFLIGVPLVAVYALTVLKIPSAAVGFTLIVRSTASLVCAPIGGWLIARVGTLTSIRMLGIALFVQTLLWTVLPTIGDALLGIAAFVVLVAAVQVTKSAFALALVAVEFEVVRPEHRVRTFTLIDVVTSTATQVKLIVGALLISASTTGALVETSFVRLDVVKVFTAVGTVIVVYLMVQYRRMARGNAQGLRGRS
jgi:hypothetical protein